MGHSQASKAQTRRRLLETAAGRFRETGLDGISLADLMKELGLTHGGFYKHFSSRNELVAAAVDCALADGEQTMRGLLFGDDRPDLAKFVNTYLSETHRDGLAAGCSLAALSGDVARKGDDLKAAFANQIERNLELIGQALGDCPAGERRSQAIRILSSLYGALMVARAVGPGALSKEFMSTVRNDLLTQK